LLNLPQSVTATGFSLSYTYDAGGQKLRKNNGTTATDYISGIQYENGAIVFIQTEEGRALKSGSNYVYEYSLADHLGNTRLSFDQNSATVIKQQDDYYPFGMEISRGFIVSPKNEYLYNKKELQEELGGVYDYGARFYDPVIARWTSIDPLAEKYRRWSTYNYGMDNPLRYIDPDGMGVKDLHLKFESAEAKAAYEAQVKSATGGQFQVKETTVKDALGYNNSITLEAAKDGGDLSKMTPEQKEFYNAYNTVTTDHSAVARQEVVQDDIDTEVGSFLSNNVDMDDIAAFDKAGPGGASSAGALIHETVEQFEKAKDGLMPSESNFSMLKKDHETAIKSEDKVNGNKRNASGDFVEKNGSTTIQVMLKSTSTISVIKTNVP
jgi:RHS repeat-associated protein